MLNGGGPQAGQHGDSRAVLDQDGVDSVLRADPRALPAHAPSVRVPGRGVKRHTATLSVAVKPPVTLPLIVASSSDAPSAKTPSVASELRAWLVTLCS